MSRVDYFQIEVASDKLEYCPSHSFIPTSICLRVWKLQFATSVNQILVAHCEFELICYRMIRFWLPKARCGAKEIRNVQNRQLALIYQITVIISKKINVFELTSWPPRFGVLAQYFWVKNDVFISSLLCVRQNHAFEINSACSVYPYVGNNRFGC